MDTFSIDVELLMEKYARFALEREDNLWHVWVYKDDGTSLHTQGRRLQTAMNNLHKLIKKK